MMPNIIKEVQHELMTNNWEQRVLFFIVTSLFVFLLMSVVPLLIKIWGYTVFLKEHWIK